MQLSLKKRQYLLQKDCLAGNNKMMSRRKFLTGAALALPAAAYYNYAGSDGFEESLRYLLPDSFQEYLIADSHAHPNRPENIKELDRLLKHLFRKDVSMQSISAILKKKYYWAYETLKEDLASFCSSDYYKSDYQLIMSDEYATVVSSQNRRLAFVRSQEVTCLSPKGKEIHLCIEGMPYFKDLVLSPEHVIEKTLNENATVILNHPYTYPTKPLIYWVASGEHEEYLKSLMQFDDLFVESFNSMNVLHMSASNGKAETLANNYGKIMVASTDCHKSDLNLTLEQLGNAGFYVPELDFNSLTGREIIQLKKELAKNSPGLYRNYCPLTTFFEVMMVQRI